MNRDETNGVGKDRVAGAVGGIISSQVNGLARSPVAAARSFAHLEARFSKQRVHRTARRLALGVAALALVAGAGGFWARSRLTEGTPEMLSYTLNGGPPLSAGRIVSSSSEPVLAFSDGTRIQMASKARGRVVELGRRGGRIALDDGRAHVQVVHRPDAQWLFEAGPFLIDVHGTAFSFAWNAALSRFDVHMESGVVSVTGPVSGGEIVLRAGESLSVGLHDHDAPVAAAAEEATRPPEGPVVDLPVSPGPPAGHAASPAQAEAPALARGAPRARPAESWVTQLADGHADEIVADAERRGLVRVLADSGSEELAALADAARYQRNDALARRVLMAQRKRFPRSVRAAEASFLLGRLDDESADGAERALAWYDRYLREAPAGAYVSEAIGRKMMVLERTGRGVEAAAIAADYLGQFPSGTYAHAAKALVRAP